jgi:hypothetical protein
MKYVICLLLIIVSYFIVFKFILKIVNKIHLLSLQAHAAIPVQGIDSPSEETIFINQLKSGDNGPNKDYTSTDGYAIMPSDGQFYKLHFDGGNFNDSRAICAQENAILAPLVNKKDSQGPIADFFVTLFNNVSLDSPYLSVENGKSIPVRIGSWSNEPSVKWNMTNGKANKYGFRQNNEYTSFFIDRTIFPTSRCAMESRICRRNHIDHSSNSCYISLSS